MVKWKEGHALSKGRRAILKGKEGAYYFSSTGFYKQIWKRKGIWRTDFFTVFKVRPNAVDRRATQQFS
jgi:hypothetical protein